MGIRGFRGFRLWAFAAGALIAAACDPAGEGFSTGPDAFSEIALVDFDAASVEFRDADGVGGWVPIGSDTALISGWDDMVAGSFGGGQGTDLLAVDFSAGHARYMTVDGDDGDLDLIVGYTNWYTGWDTVDAGDMNGDTLADTVLVDLDQGIASVNTMASDGSLTQVFYADNWYTGYDLIAVGQFTGSAHHDLVAIDSDIGFIAVVENDGTGQLSQVWSSSSIGLDWTDVDVGDLDGDGLDDLLLTELSAGRADMWTAGGSGGFTQLASATNWWTAWDHVVLGDFGGSGAADVLALDDATAQAAVLLGDGAGGLTQIAFGGGWPSTTDVLLSAPDRNAQGWTAPDPLSFTTSNFDAGLRQLSGDIPTLAVLLEPAGLSMSFANSYYDSLVFGPGWPSIHGFIDENSDGAAGLVRAGPGLVGPYPAPTGWADIFEYRKLAIDIAAQNGFDFDAMDANGDGTVTNDELVVFLIIATPTSDTTGINRSTSPSCFIPTGESLEVCLNLGSVSEHASFATYAHELLHSRGATDLYGSSGAFECRGQGVTLMSCTTGGPADRRDIHTHLDAWHKVAFGWDGFRSYRSNGPGNCLALEPQGADGATGIDMVALWDPARGPDEFFLLENRQAAAGLYDGNLNGDGLAVWNVVSGPTGPSFLPSTILPGDGTGGTTAGLQSAVNPADIMFGAHIRAGYDRRLDSTAVVPADLVGTAFSVGLVGAGSTQGGRGRPWRASDGVFEPNWFGDTAGPVEIAVGPPDAAGVIEVAWGPAPLTGPAGDGAVASCFARVLGTS